MEHLIGKKAYKTNGFFSGIVGTIERNNNSISPYKLVLPGGTAVGIRDEQHIVLVEEGGGENE